MRYVQFTRPEFSNFISVILQEIKRKKCSWVYFTIIFLVFASPEASAQSSADFQGLWVGYIKIQKIPRYRVFANFSSPTSKMLKGEIKIFEYGNPKSVIKAEDVQLEYDKEKEIAFYNTKIPNLNGESCGGYLIFKIDKKKEGFLDVKFRTSQTCMVSEIVMGNTEHMISDTVFKFETISNTQTATQKTQGGYNAISQNTVHNDNPGAIAKNVKYIEADKLHPFKEGVARIEKGQSTALIDTNGNFIIPYNKYNILYDAKDGMIIAREVIPGASKYSGALYLLSTSGKVIFSSAKVPVAFDTQIHDGFIELVENPIVFYINKTGLKITQPKELKYQNNKLHINTMAAWPEGLTTVSYQYFKDSAHRTGQANKFGFINRRFEIKIKPEYDYVEAFSEGLAVVGNQDEFGNMKYGFIDKNGIEIIPLGYSKKPSNFANGLALVTPVNSNDFNFAYINSKNEIILKLKIAPDKQLVSYAEGFKDGWARFSPNYGRVHGPNFFYINVEGTMIGHNEFMSMQIRFNNFFSNIGEKDMVSGFSLAEKRGPNNAKNLEGYVNAQGIWKILLKEKSVF